MNQSDTTSSLPALGRGIDRARAWPADRRRMVVLFHASQDETDLPLYLISGFTEIWREDGWEVTFLFGLDTFVPAEVCIVHVDLSVVPDEYIRFARRYPVVLNDRIRDVRKSAFSRLRVGRDSACRGPVIVKTDLNYAGHPELLATGRVRPEEVDLGALEYQIYPDLAEVPAEVFERDDYVVEKFLPEREGDLYFVRFLLVLGDRFTSRRIAAPSPIVRERMMASQRRIAPHPGILAERERLGVDYGKLDYVVHDGEAYLLDVNKTIGGGDAVTYPDREVGRRERAEGIYSYLDRLLAAR